MHPLLRLLVDRPQLLAEHVDAYAALIAVEVPRISAAWQRSALLHALALGSALVGTTLAGVSVMLWATAPAVPPPTLWILLAVPAVPLVAALAFALAARSAHALDATGTLREQVRADIAMWRQAVAS